MDLIFVWYSVNLSKVHSVVRAGLGSVVRAGLGTWVMYLGRCRGAMTASRLSVRVEAKLTVRSLSVCVEEGFWPLGDSLRISGLPSTANR